MACKQFFFAPEYQLTRSVQDNLKSGLKTHHSWDSDFFWNHRAMGELLSHPWLVTPLVSGLLEHSTSVVNG